MARRVTFQYRNNPETTSSIQVDIAPYEEPGQLYCFAFKHLSGKSTVSTAVEFRGISCDYLAVLQDNGVMPGGGHIMHENSQRRVAGQIGLINKHGVVYLLVMQWRRLRRADWEWYSAHAVDWKTFRDNVHEVFAHCVVLAQLNMLAINSQQNLIQSQEPMDVQLSYQNFGDHELQGGTMPKTVIQGLFGELDLYDRSRRLVFGSASNDFRPVKFRGMLGNVQENANGVAMNLPVPNI